MILVIAGNLNACMDVVANCFDSSVFAKLNRKFFDPSESWKNKWKYNKATKAYTEEAFFLSSTILVCFTDFWHLCKTAMLLLIFISAALYKIQFGAIIDFLSFYIVFTGSFEISYRIYRKQSII